MYMLLLCLFFFLKYPCVVEILVVTHFNKCFLQLKEKNEILNVIMMISMLLFKVLGFELFNYKHSRLDKVRWVH